MTAPAAARQTLPFAEGWVFAWPARTQLTHKGLFSFYFPLFPAKAATRLAVASEKQQAVLAAAAAGQRELEETSRRLRWCAPWPAAASADAAAHQQGGLVAPEEEGARPSPGGEGSSISRLSRPAVDPLAPPCASPAAAAASRALTRETRAPSGAAPEREAQKEAEAERAARRHNTLEEAAASRQQQAHQELDAEREAVRRELDGVKRTVNLEVCKAPLLPAAGCPATRAAVAAA